MTRDGLLHVALAAAVLLATARCSAAEIDFVHEIVPILRQHCGNCHTGGEMEGGFSMNTRASLLAGGDGGPAVLPGDSGSSPLVERISTADTFMQMPPEGPRLPEAQVALLRRWIDAGAPWQSGFSFHQSSYEPPLFPRRPELPSVVEGRDHPLDRILDAYFAQHQLSPPAAVDDATFLRRVSLDVTGLPPAPERLDEFLRDQREDRRRRLIDELLADDVAYAEHWLSFWNDLLRNDYTGTGFITGGRKQITDWLYRSLLENKPYDRFVRELIAPQPESEGFIQGIRWRGDVSASQTPEVQFAQNISQAFLGINMKCASCHNSFIDRWTLEETYGLAAIYVKRPLEIHRCDKPLGTYAQPAWIFPELGQIQAEAPQPERLQQLADLMTHPENGRFLRTIVNRLWHRLMGRGIVHPVDAMHTPPWSADLLDYLAVHLADSGYDLKSTIRLICTSQAYQAQTHVQSEAEDADYVFHGPLARRMTAEQFMDAVWQITAGGPAKPDVPVVRARSDSAAGDAQEDQPPSPPRMVRAALMKNDAFMAALGRPTRDQIVSMRPSELTTLEAIRLSNGQELADVLARGADRLVAEHEATDALADWLFRAALSRPATDEELRLARELLGDRPGKEQVQDLLWAVFMLPEFQLVR